MVYSRIIGTGSYTPAQILSNADLEEKINTSDEWIVKRVGVKQRHIIGDSGENTTTMALSASRAALAQAAISPDDIDMIIVGTATPEYYFPSTSCVLHRELGITREIPAFDLNAACAGFIYAMNIADQSIRDESVKTVLVVGTEALTRLVDWTDRKTCILFGDGAGAVVIQASKTPGIMATCIQSDGKGADFIAADNPIWSEGDHEGRLPPSYIRMQGKEVFKIAVTKLGEIVDAVLKKGGLKKENVDWLIPHQANLRIIQAIAKRLDLPLERVVLTVERHGNTSAASVPLALDCAIRSGMIKRGDILLLEAFGAGMAWGATLLEY